MDLFFPFVNNEIFSGGDDDYIIGGFVTSQIENFKYANFYSALVERIKSLMEDYVEKTAIIRMQEGNENPQKAALHDCAMVIGDNLNIPVEVIDIEGMTNTILYSPYMQNWLTRIKTNVKEYQNEETDITQYKGVFNEAVNLSSEEKSEYVSLIHDTTFEMLIEAISMVEI
jgi:hypothetical protein